MCGAAAQTADSNGDGIHVFQRKIVPITLPVWIKVEAKLISVFPEQSAAAGRRAGVSNPVHSSGHSGLHLKTPMSFIHEDGLTAGYQCSAFAVIAAVGTKPHPVLVFRGVIHRIYDDPTTGVILIQDFPGIAVQIHKIQFHRESSGNLLVGQVIIGIEELVLHTMKPCAPRTVFHQYD